MAVRCHLERSTVKLTLKYYYGMLHVQYVSYGVSGIQNSVQVFFAFYCTRIFKSKMASRRHLKGSLESSFCLFVCFFSGIQNLILV